MIITTNREYISSTVMTEKELQPIITKIKCEGKRIGMCNGSFDLLHPGHINHLRAAKSLCEVLIIVIATDEFNQKSRASRGRPIFNQEIRAFTISQIKAVDYVIISDDNISLIRSLKPDLLIKGMDYKNSTHQGLLEQQRVMEEVGGKFVLTSSEKLSTTEIIRYIKEEIK